MSEEHREQAPCDAPGRMPGSLGGLTTRAMRAHARLVQRCFERTGSSAHSLHRPPNTYGVRAERCGRSDSEAPIRVAGFFLRTMRSE